jgi:hypothetical protein
MSPFRARVKAANLLSLYAGRGANSARVLNDKNEELYKFLEENSKPKSPAPYPRGYRRN